MQNHKARKEEGRDSVWGLQLSTDLSEKISYEEIICEQRLERGKIVRLKNKYKSPAIGQEHSRWFEEQQLVNEDREVEIMSENK